MLLYFVEDHVHDKTIIIVGGGHRLDAGIHLSANLFNQKQLKSVLVYMTLCLPFTSLEDDWHSQSISHCQICL